MKFQLEYFIFPYFPFIFLLVRFIPQWSLWIIFETDLELPSEWFQPSYVFDHSPPSTNQIWSLSFFPREDMISRFPDNDAKILSSTMSQNERRSMEVTTDQAFRLVASPTKTERALSMITTKRWLECKGF